MPRRAALPLTLARVVSLRDSGRPDDWEEAPQTKQARRRLLIAVVVLALIAVVGFRTRSAPGSTLAIGPSPAPATSDAEAAEFERVAFRAVVLEPVQTVGEEAGTGPVLSDTTATSILALDVIDLHVIDVASGDVRTVRLPSEMTEQDRVRRMFGVGEHVIVTGFTTVTRLSGDSLQPTRIASGYTALPTYAESSVWLVPPRASNASRRALRIGPDGAVQASVALSAEVDAVAGTSDHLVVSAPGGARIISAGRGLSIRRSGLVAAVAEDRLARTECSADLACRTVIGTVDGPDQARSPLRTDEVPAGYYGAAMGEFSPDGRWLALPVLGTGNGSTDQIEVLIVDTTLGTEVGRVRVPIETRTAWTPDSRWLVLSHDRGLRAWSMQQRRAVELDVAVDGVRALVVR